MPVAQPTLTQRRFLFDWDYALAFDLTKTLTLNFNATNSYIYDSFGADENLEIYDRFFDIGRPDHYHQTLNATYKLPLNKIPVFDFITADYGYTADFDWAAGSQSFIDQVGNIIQNDGRHNLGANIDFSRFYKNIKLDKLLIKGDKSSRKNKANPTLGASKQTKRNTSVRKLKKERFYRTKNIKRVLRCVNHG